VSQLPCHRTGAGRGSPRTAGGDQCPSPRRTRRSHKYRIRGQRLHGERTDPPEEIVEGVSELNAADIYFLMHGKRKIAVFQRVR
jgi:hypothetical protein